MTCSGPVNRRGFLRWGSLALGGLSLADRFELRAQSGAPTDDTSVIFIWLPGGPPHMETYDMKPDAPSEYRGAFLPRKTNVPGIEVCEHLPLHAKCADKYALIRSIAHDFADHGGGHKRFLTGRDPKEPTGFVNDYPMAGSFVAKKREHVKRGLPNYIAGADDGRTQVDVFSFGAAYLGASATPFLFGGDPSSPKFTVRDLSLEQGMAARLEDRQTLLSGFDQMRRQIDQRGVMEAMDAFGQQALEIMTSPRSREAFDLSKEPRHVRERYGMHAWGQRALMARRLVEAGVSFVTMVMENPFPGREIPKDCTYNWDSHAVNCHIFDDFLWRVGVYDQAVTALVEDLHARGLDKKTLLVVTGEFGRTPRVSYSNGRPGRDHWPNAMSMLISGGGLRMGQVIGATDAKGERPSERALTPNDLWATVYRHLGIDPNEAFLDRTGRPMPILPYGEPIAELI